MCHLEIRSRQVILFNWIFAHDQFISGGFFSENTAQSQLTCLAAPPMSLFSTLIQINARHLILQSSLVLPPLWASVRSVLSMLNTYMLSLKSCAQLIIWPDCFKICVWAYILFTFPYPSLLTFLCNSPLLYRQISLWHEFLKLSDHCHKESPCLMQHVCPCA